MYSFTVNGNRTLTTTFQSTAGITYVNTTGNAQLCDNFETISSAMTTLNTGWYAVAGNVTIANRIEIVGSVNLILCDGATLTVPKGIHLTGGNALTIWGQSAGTGALVIESPGVDKAGIGGNELQPGGIFTMNGGTLTVTGGQYGAGIGGGANSNGGQVTVRGGMVTIHAGTGAAIGRGGKYNFSLGANDNEVNDGSLTVNGMRVGTVDGENTVTWVAAADRVDTCHGKSRTIRLEPCVDHEFVNDTCLWCGATPSPYDLWAANSSITGAWDATDAGGVANVFRYVFDVPEGPVTNPPLLSISFDASGETAIDESASPSRFFRLKATEQ